jgi:non-heme chloroperoxidase
MNGNGLDAQVGAATTSDSKDNVPKPTIVLIHGLWMTPLCWEDWLSHFEAKGYNVLAPGWPGVGDRTPEEIRKAPGKLAGLKIHEIVHHYEQIIKDLSQPPIIIGHSFGGLFVQILLSRGYGVAGVGICPAPPAGILALKGSTIKAAFGVLGNPFTYNAAVPFTEKQFHYAFGNHLTTAESKELWERYSIPSAAHVLWQGALAGFSSSGDGHVDFLKKNRAPLLLIGGTGDHVVPAGVVEVEKRHYKGPAVVELKILEGKTHGIVNQQGWEEVADFVLMWIGKHLST